MKASDQPQEEEVIQKVTKDREGMNGISLYHDHSCKAVRLFDGRNPISANLIKASAQKMYFVPEGQHRS
jgi:hypothetical protein